MSLRLLCMLTAMCWAYGMKDPRSTIISQWPMIAAHDAATSYLKPGLINQWAKTQNSGGISAMLDCGARFFDWRPKLKSDGSLIMHHGPINVDYQMSKVLDELILWSLNRTDSPEKNFVVLGITDCDGGSACTKATRNELERHNITFLSDCTMLSNLTVASAMSLSPSGPILAIGSCWNENYDPNVTCTGFLKTQVGSINPNALNPNRLEYTCYNDSSTKSFPFNRMLNYINMTLSSGSTKNTMFAVQVLWQETPASIIVSGLHKSNIILDETRSELNHIIATKIMNGEINISRINLLEINNVCDGGQALMQAIFAK